MLTNAIGLCPDELWQRQTKFYYLSYHTAIFLDYYLTQPVKDFQPALSYTLTDETLLPPDAVDDVLPSHFYSRPELLSYMAAIREKCKTLITRSGEEQLTSKWIEVTEVDLHGLCPSLVTDYNLLEILFYNFRHVQHHVAQLNMLLRQEIDQAPDWVALAED